MKTQASFVLMLLFLATAAVAEHHEPPAPEVQIAGALTAAPEGVAEGATVMGYNAEGELVPLQEGDGLLVCLADKPGDDRFHAACYHKDLEPFMARGRELKAEGITKTSERHKIQHAEVDEGKLPFPKDRSTSLFTYSGKSYDAESGTVEGGKRMYVVYMPYATAESTGLPTGPVEGQPSAPWIMRMGTASAHLMITPDMGKK